MRIDNAVIKDGCLCLHVEDIREAYQWLNSFKVGEYDILPHKEKRSKTANALAWTLMGKIASKVGIPILDVYRNEIQDISVKQDIVWCSHRALAKLHESWCENHLGRDVKTIDDDGQNATVMMVYGSSDFNREEMSKLIDHIIQDCKELGIETKPQEYVDSLLEEWDAKH